MLTNARALRAHLIRKENEWYAAKRAGDTDRTQELDKYILGLRIRLARAEAGEIVAA